MDSLPTTRRLGRRRTVQHRLPHPAYGASEAGERNAAEAPIGADHATTPRPQSSFMGDVDRRRARKQSLCRYCEDAPLHDRRGFGGRPHEDPDEPDTRKGNSRRASLCASQRSDRSAAAARRVDPTHQPASGDRQGRQPFLSGSPGYPPGNGCAHQSVGRGPSGSPCAAFRPRPSTMRSDRTAVSIGSAWTSSC